MSFHYSSYNSIKNKLNKFSLCWDENEPCYYYLSLAENSSSLVYLCSFDLVSFLHYVFA